MGLTQRQTDQVLEPVERKWGGFESKRINEVRKQLEDANRDIQSDPGYRKLIDTFNEYTGMDWVTGYRSPHEFVISILQSNWALYKAGIIAYPAYAAYERAGYDAQELRVKNFTETAEGKALSIALRTTRMNWTRLADPYSNFVIGISMATTPEDLLKTCNEFLRDLR